MRIERIDHLVLTVRDLEATCRFYESVLGMQREVFGEGRTALRFGTQKINLHQAGKEFEPKALHPVPGSADLCFITTSAPEETLEHVRAHGIEIVAGPVAKIGALGAMESVYIRDPDGNLIEIARYPSPAAPSATPLA